MKRLVKSVGIEAALNSAGLSYTLNVADYKVAPTEAALNSAGLSYGLKSNEYNTFTFVALNSAGLSYSLRVPVVSAATANTVQLIRVSAVVPVSYHILQGVMVSTPVSYVVKDYSTDFVELSISYRDLPVSDIAFTSTYPSGYTTVEHVFKEVGYAKGQISLTTQNLDVDYHYASGVDLVNRNLRKSLKVSYFDRLKAIKSVSFDIRKNLQFSNALSYSSVNRLTVSKSINYTSFSRVVKATPVSYPIIATIYRLSCLAAVSYDIKAARLVKSKALSYTSYSSLKVNNSVSYSVGYVRLRKSVSTTYNSFNALQVIAPISYTVRQSLISLATVSYSKNVHIAKSIGVSYHSPIRLEVPYSTGYEIRDFNRLQKTMPITYFSVKEITTVVNTPNQTLTLPDGTKVPSGNTIYQSQDVDVIEVEPVVVIGKETIYVMEMSISIDEGNYTYGCDLTLANYADLVKFEANKPFYVVLQGEVYSFLVDSRTLNREEVNAPQAKVRGLSPTSHFTGPRSKQIIGTTFSEAYTANQIANRLLYDPKINYTIGDSSNDLTAEDASKINLHWEIQDWGIPPYRYGAENTYPLDALKTIVEAVGGVVEATPDGHIRARYKFPVRVPDYSDLTTDHFFYDSDDIISIQENHAPNRMVNAVYVKTYQDMGIQDTIEYFDQLSAPDNWGTIDKLGGGIVRVFPAIWRDTVDLSHNRNDDPDVYLEYQGVEDWIPNEWVNPEFGWETIDIVKGQGSTKYPITKVLGYGYMSDNAGEIIVNDYSRTFYTKSEDVRFSIVKLKYQTRCHRWKLVAKAGTHIQFKIADTVFNTYLR